jgi:hypothetical protein
MQILQMSAHTDKNIISEPYVKILISIGGQRQPENFWRLLPSESSTGLKTGRLSRFLPIPDGQTNSEFSFENNFAVQSLKMLVSHLKFVFLITRVPNLMCEEKEKKSGKKAKKVKK